MNTVIINFGKIKSYQQLLAAGKHNYRLINTEIGLEKGGKINPQHSYLNKILNGTDNPKELRDGTKRIIEANYSRKLRKDAVIAVEIMFSPNSNFSMDFNDFFEDCLQWTKDYYQLPILSAVSHFDETSPHLHVLMLPLKNGCMIGSKIIGYKSNLRYMKESFHSRLATKYQLIQYVKKENYSSEQIGMITNLIIKKLFCLSNMNNWSITELSKAIKKYPFHIAQAIGIEMPKSIRSTYIEELQRMNSEVYTR